MNYERSYFVFLNIIEYLCTKMNKLCAVKMWPTFPSVLELIRVEPSTLPTLNYTGEWKPPTNFDSSQFWEGKGWFLGEKIIRLPPSRQFWNNKTPPNEFYTDPRCIAIFLVKALPMKILSLEKWKIPRYIKITPKSLIFSFIPKEFPWARASNNFHNQLLKFFPRKSAARKYLRFSIPPLYTQYRVTS